MNKEMMMELKKRLSQAERRLMALDLEKSNLTTEVAHLTELVKLYDSYDYDPIEEERRNTEALLNGSGRGVLHTYEKKEEPVKERAVVPNYTKKSGDETRKKIIEVLTVMGRPLTCKEIAELMNRKGGSIHGILQQMSEKGEIYKIEKINKYELKGDR